MIKSAALVLVITLSILAIAASSFSLNFDGMTVYPLGSDDTTYSRVLPTDNIVSQVPLS